VNNIRMLTVTVLISATLMWLTPFESGNASETTYQPFSYVESFEHGDPFQFWVSNGSYTTHFKGLSPNRASHGTKSFKLDIELHTATYVYLIIPLRVPCIGTLNYEGDLFVESITGNGTEVALGTHVNYWPYYKPGDGASPITKIDTVTNYWITQTADLVEIASLRATEIAQSTLGGASHEDIGKWNEYLNLYIYSPQGGSIVVYLDNLIVEGYVPSDEAYQSMADAAWHAYLERIDGQVTTMADFILNFQGSNLDAQEEAYIIEAKDTASTIKSSVKNRGWPTVEEFAALTDLYDSIQYLAQQQAPAHEALRVFAVTPISGTKVLPTTYPVPGMETNQLHLQACRGEFQPASFVIRAGSDLSGVQITSSELARAGGGNIPSQNVDIRLVKCWYQAGDGTVYKTPQKPLVPELLLKDLALVRVDHESHRNYLRVILNGLSQYVDISSPDASVPPGAQIQDAAQLQPFDMKGGTNQQVWITIRVPEESESGIYTGSLSLKTDQTDSVSLSLNVEVLPFDLEPSVIEYGLYYRGVLSESGLIGSERKTSEQYAAELRNMKDHGVLYPTIYQSPDSSKVGQALSLRNSTGIPKNRLYVCGTNTWGSPSTTEELAQLRAKVDIWMNLSAQYGYSGVHIYGHDELDAPMVANQRPSWDEIHTAGAKVFVACNQDVFDVVGDILDLPIIAFGLISEQQLAAWHAQGARVFSYNNPQVGIEDPEIYRKRYGLSLFAAGYDGVMNYAYQHAEGDIWNDFDGSALYRDHVFAYPTSGGVIDTVQWEGFREAVDDMRYLSTWLARIQDSESVRNWLKDRLSQTADLDSIRAQIVEKILSNTPVSPTVPQPPKSLRILPGE